MNPGDPETAAIAGMVGAVVWVGVSGVLGAPDVLGALVFGVTFAAVSYVAATRFGGEPDGE